MAFVLQNYNTQDTYNPQLGQIIGRGRSLLVLVTGASVYVSLQEDQRGIRPGNGTWSADILLPAGHYTWQRRLMAARVKSAVPGISALVTMELA